LTDQSDQDSGSAAEAGKEKKRVARATPFSVNDLPKFYLKSL
jgi:hypothetical protein